MCQCLGRSVTPKAHGRVTTTEDGRKNITCFGCNKQGHIKRNCPEKDKQKKKEPAKAHTAEAEDSGDEDAKTSASAPPAWTSYINSGRALPEEDKLHIVKMAAGLEPCDPEDEDF